ncbi:MAG: glycosyltransferase [Patulibacter sp.]|nr:glycosyltransferase [Patulibacter sp.]
MTDPELLAEFEARFRADADPWRFETSDYERAKRADTLRACGDLTGARVLELGAANGVLAADLARAAGSVVAIEAVVAAAQLGTERLAPFTHAAMVEGLIPSDVPGGPYDLVVASEILYYLDEAAYAETLHALPGWLAPGGRLVAVHWRPDGPERPRGAAAVHDDLAALPFLEVVEASVRDEYLLSVLRHRPDALPAPPRDAWVVMPARDEVDRLGDAVDAVDVAAQHAAAGRTHLVLVDDGSTDGTSEVARAAARAWRHGTAVVLAGPGAGSGWARRTGLDHALLMVRRAADGEGLIATTDADSRVPPHWLSRLHALVDAGHEVIAGDIALEPGTHPQLVAARAARLAGRLADVLRTDPRADHPHFAGANLGFTARALASLEPLPTPSSLEDDALRARCEALTLPILRDASFAVTTSPRLDGRAAVGLASALAADAGRLGLLPNEARTAAPPPT